MTEFDPELIHLYLNDDDEVATPLVSEFKSFDEFYCEKTFYTSGGMKAIYKIRDLRTNRFVAMAEIKKEGENADLKNEQFLREARIAAALEHPNILPVYDIGLHNDGSPFFTMKLMKGVSLDRILKEKVKLNPFYGKRFDQSSLLEIFVKVCEAVSYAHSCRVVHLDIKPSNIMIGDYGEVYICDWGIAKILDSTIAEYQEIISLDEGILNDITLSGVMKGTPGFMAPEQIDKKFGKKCEQTDIYSLGALLYSMLIYKRPLAGSSSEQTIKATTSGKIPVPKAISEQIPDSLNAICIKSMATYQGNRYNSVKELLSDLRAYQEGFATQAENASPFKLFQLLLKRNKWFFIMMLMIIVTGVIVGGVSGSFLMKSKLEAQKKITSIQEAADKLERLLEEEKSKFLVDRSKATNAEAVHGNSIVLNGVNQFISNKQIPFKHGTMAFWFKPYKTSSSYPKFFQIGQAFWHVDNISEDRSGGLVAGAGRAYVYKSSIGGALWYKWHHFAMTVTRSGKTVFYIDGIEVNINIKYTGEKGLILGSWFGSGSEQTLKASFDELSLWNLVLNREDILEVANHTLKGNEKGLVGYYSFDGDTQNKVSDKYHLKAVGKPRFSK